MWVLPWKRAWASKVIGVNMKPWQKGYELEYLRGLEERWDGYNKHSL